jgi:hypothetical protein
MPAGAPASEHVQLLTRVTLSGVGSTAVESELGMVLTYPVLYVFIHNTPTRKRSHQAQDIHTSHTSHLLHSNARRHVTHTALTDTDQSRHTPGQPRV